ncbi:MAG: hypothetical protein ABI367_14780 [Mucilaginibacter sp.]
MKKTTLITFMLALGVSVYAQRPMRPHPAKLPPKLEADLKLTPEQQTKVADILKSRNFEMDSLAKKVTFRNGKFIGDKMKSEMSEVNGKLYAILNIDQKLIYAQYIMDRQAQMGKGRGPGPRKSPPPANQ